MAYKSMREKIQEREREREQVRAEMEQEDRKKGMAEALEVNRRELLRTEKEPEQPKKIPSDDKFEKLVEKLRSQVKNIKGEEDAPEVKKSLLFDRISEAYDILEKKGRIGK